MKQMNCFFYRTIAITSAITVQLVGSLLIGIFVGRWLEVRFSFEPLFMIIWLFLGLAIGVYGNSHLLKDKIQGD